MSNRSAFLTNIRTFVSSMTHPATSHAVASPGKSDMPMAADWPDKDTMSEVRATVRKQIGKRKLKTTSSIASKLGR